MNFILGRTKSNTLELFEDEVGLYFRVKLPNTSQANDLHESIKRGDISQCSFWFEVVESRWIYNEEEEMDLRELVKVKLYELGPVTFPAYEDTEVEARRKSFDSTKHIKPDKSVSRMRSIFMS